MQAKNLHVTNTISISRKRCMSRNFRADKRIKRARMLNYSFCSRRLTLWSKDKLHWKRFLRKVYSQHCPYGNCATHEDFLSNAPFSLTEKNKGHASNPVELVSMFALNLNNSAYSQILLDTRESQEYVPLLSVLSKGRAQVY